MKPKPMIGTDEWKQGVINDLTALKNNLLSMKKDMTAYRVECIIDELKEFFKQNEGKN